METKINVISQSENELEVTLTYEEIAPEIEKAYMEERKKIELPGFRKGKVPMSMLKKMFGPAIENQATEKISGTMFWKIADEQQLNPISTPSIIDINFEPDVKLYFKIRYEIKPKFELKDYKGQDIERIVFNVDDEHINSEIEYLQRTNSTTADADTVEDNYSILTVDLQKIDESGAAVEGAFSQDLKIDLSQPTINPQIAENASGKKAGDKFTFEFDDQKEVEEEGVKKLVPEKMKYEAVIKNIQKIVLPALDEEFIKKISKGKFDTVESWKENMRTGLQRYYDAQSDDMLISKIKNMVIKNNDFAPPHGYVHNLLDRMVKYEEDQAKQEGKKRFDPNEAHKRLHGSAEYTAKWYILLENLANQENLAVSEDDLKEMAEKEAAETGISAEKLIKYYQESNRSYVLLEDKVIDFLKKNNNIKEVNAKDVNNTTEEEG
ncbi:MAG: trigger factor [Syntrophothermus sp.]